MSDLAAKIKSAYERELKSAPSKVFRAEELPISYEAITTDWLSDVLCAGHPGSAVVEVHMDAPDNGSANRRKIQVVYNSAGAHAGLPQRLFCKASHDLVNRTLLGMSGGAHAEVTFYNALRPRLDIEAPQSFFARYDPESFNSLIILLDVSRSVTEFCNHKTTIDRKRAESQVALLARFHGRGYGDAELRQRLKSLNTWPQFFGDTLNYGMRECSNQGFLAAKEVIPPRLYARLDEIWPATLNSVEVHDHMPHTLSHGDVHLKNWYVAGTGEMGLGDWQCATRGHWGRDFSYTLATALTIENRRAWEKDLLRSYLEQMQAAGGPAMSFEEGWKHYRQQLITALTWWTFTLTPPKGLPDMQPRDTSLEFIRRISTAMDDVDTLGGLN